MVLDDVSCVSVVAYVIEDDNITVVITMYTQP